MAAVSGYCSRWRWVATGGGVAVADFLFLLSFSLLLLPLAFRLFYCSSSFFPFSPLVLGKEKPMVMLSFVCWFLASLTFSSSLFLLPIPCSAASGSCGWCCRKVKLMMMFFLLIFLCWVDVLTPGSSCLVWLLCDFPDFIPSCCPCSAFFLFVLPLFFFCVFLSLLPPVSIVSPSVFFRSSVSPLFYLSLLLCFLTVTSPLSFLFSPPVSSCSFCFPLYLVFSPFFPPLFSFYAVSFLPLILFFFCVSLPPFHRLSLAFISQRNALRCNVRLGNGM